MHLEFRNKSKISKKYFFGSIEIGGKLKSIISHTTVMLQDEDDYNRSI